MFEDRKRDRGLVERERLHDRGGRLRAAREYLGHRLTHQRGWIIKEHQERAFGGRAILPGKIGNEPGPRQRARRVRPHTGRGGSDPTDKLPNDHVPAGLRNQDDRGANATLQPKINHDA